MPMDKSHTEKRLAIVDNLIPVEAVIWDAIAAIRSGCMIQPQFALYLVMIQWVTTKVVKHQS